MCGSGPYVVPLVGTWIEIRSVPLIHGNELVVPLVGTWIEICRSLGCIGMVLRRAPRGHVD